MNKRKNKSLNKQTKKNYVSYVFEGRKMTFWRRDGSVFFREKRIFHLREREKNTFEIIMHNETRPDTRHKKRLVRF